MRPISIVIIFGGQLLNNYAIYLTDITQLDSQMTNVPIDQNVIWKYFKSKPTCTIKDKNELILSENPINTSRLKGAEC